MAAGPKRADNLVLKHLDAHAIAAQDSEDHQDYRRQKYDLPTLHKQSNILRGRRSGCKLILRFSARARLSAILSVDAGFNVLLHERW